MRRGLALPLLLLPALVATPEHGVKTFGEAGSRWQAQMEPPKASSGGVGAA